MAGRAQGRQQKENSTDNLPVPTLERDDLREVVAKLYGQGVPRAKIARMLVDHLVPHRKHRPLEQRLSQARTKLRGWENSPDFRDLVWKHGLVKLDLATPQILKGVERKAKQGRVDAARLALEVTGRHNPKGDASPTTVVIAFDGIPRPEGAQAVAAIEDGTVVDGEVMVEEDDEV